MSPAQLPQSPAFSGRLLRLAQVAWLLVALFYAVTFLLALPGLLAAPATVPSWPAWTQAEAQQALAQLGWSPAGLQGFLTVANLVGAPAYVLLGGFLFWRRRTDPVALMFAFMFCGFLTTTQFQGLAQHAPVWTHIDDLNSAFTSTLFFVIFMTFPDGRFVPRWTRWAALVVAAIEGLRVLQPGWYASVAFVIATPMIVIQMLVQLYRYWRVSGPVQRQQTKWVVFGLAASVLPLSAYLLLVGLVPELTRPTAMGMAMLVLGNLLWEAVLILLPLSLTLAILRSRLFDIDVIIRRTLVYAVLTGLLALAYFGSVIVLQNTFSALTGQSQSTLVTVLSTLVIAALFVPLRRRVQAIIDRRLFRSKYDAARTLMAFGASVRDEVDMEALTEHLVGVVDETLQPQSIGVWLRSGGPAGAGAGETR